MNEPIDNPFGATRAADFTDDQIAQYWVDIEENGHGFFELFKPRSELPMVVLGGKGSGKTHAMRYLSFPLQQIRHQKDLLAGVQAEGYVGIYLRCSGLNSTRFSNKGQTPERWAEVFSYYMELWLAQLVTNVAVVLCDASGISRELEAAIVTDVQNLFDDKSFFISTTLRQLAERLKAAQKELDISINNCVFDGELKVTVRATSGRLIYGIPRVLTHRVARLANCMFVYLLDEFENLTETQQIFVNTLLREKQPPCSFKIGSRLYGIITSVTYCAGEENKEGSEFESLPLDSRMRSDSGRYREFANRLVEKRLISQGIETIGNVSLDGSGSSISNAFESPQNSGLAKPETDFVIKKYGNRPRPYFRTLNQVLKQGFESGVTPGLRSKEIANNFVVENLECYDFPLLEKLNCFLFYQHWHKNANLAEAAATIRDQCKEYLQGGDKNSDYHDRLLHFKYDLLAQLRRECNQKQVYAGWQTLIDLSWGNPRHLLILLRHIFSWASFKGEKSFGAAPVSIAAQVAGVREAATWFYNDAEISGEDGRLVLAAISRLGSLFRTIRYSHKPSECSLCTFSYDPAAVTSTTRRLIDLAEKWSLMVDVERGQRDRNTQRIDAKLQINRLLAPIWDISFYRRGAIPLPAADVNAIFDPDHSAQFEEMRKLREARMMAPFFGTRGSKRQNAADGQGLLPGMTDD